MPVCAARAEPGAPFATSGSASAAAAVAVYADSGRRARPPPAPPMAGVSDCFTLGSTVWCRTCHNKEIEGEVMAFDLQTKILILKCASPNGPNNLNDVNFINLALVKELQVKKEVTTAPDVPVSLNLQRLNTRIRNSVEEKKRLLTKMSSNVTPEGQRLFRAIAKTIKEVRWNNNDIVVFDKVTISPPYQLENVRGRAESREFEYITKVVEKHVKDTALQNQSLNQQQQSHQQQVNSLQ
ncbi:protein LSM12-like [Atheta coriaria]|uniref:protein LSM12-like n=1 Tax=Dalotia coriaria TaxID=877792 RepID=UPI0031F3A2C4